MNWEELILEGLKPGNDFLQSLSKATDVAPPKIRKILTDFPISMNYTKKDIETLKKDRQGIILLLLYYFWLSLCGEAFQIFSLDTQKRILEEGVRASLEASTLASSINNKEIEASFLYRAGRALYDLGDLSQAEDIFKKTLLMFRSLAEKNPSAHNPHAASILNNLGLIYYDTKRFQEAEKAFTEALEKYAVLQQVNPQRYNHFTALTFTNLGALYSHIQVFEKSEKCHIEALKIYRRLAHKNPDTYNPSLATSLSNLGSLYWKMKVFDKSETFYREALTIRRTLAKDNPDIYNSDLVITLCNVGVLYSDTGRFSDAENVFKEALTIMRALVKKYPDIHVHVMVKALDNLGNLYSKMGRFSEAEELLKEALTIKRTLVKKYPHRFDSELALTLRNVGVFYYRAGRIMEAEKAFTEALKSYRERAQTHTFYSIDIAGILNELGVLYNKMGRFSQAEEAFTEALKITREYREKNACTEDIAMILTNLGTLYWDIQEFSRADDVFKEALAVTRTLAKKNPAYNTYVAAALNNLGNLYSDMDSFSKAEQVYTEVLELYRDGEKTDAHKDGVADTLHNLGALYRKYQHFAKAEEASLKALSIMRTLARKNPDAYNAKVAMILNNLGALYQDMNNLSKAQKTYEEALKINKMEENWLDIAETYHNISIFSKNRSEEAIQILELGILFSGEEKYTYAHKGRRESIYLRFLAYMDDPQRLFGILEALRDPDLLSLKWDLKKIQEAKENKNLQKKIVKKLPKSLPLNIPFQIPEDFLFLYIQKMDNDIVYFAVTEDGQRIVRGSPEFVNLGVKLLVNLRVQMLGGMCDKDLTDIITKFDRILMEWTNIIPLEIVKIIRDKNTIIFSPDAVCSSFPLEGLSIDGEPLCLSKTILRATSMHQLKEVFQRTLVTDSSLIVGNPWPNSKEKSFSYSHPRKIGPIRYLESAEREAYVLAERLPNPVVLTGVNTTADRFLKGLSHHSLIHFAGHGYLGRILFFSGPARFLPEFEVKEFSELRRAWRHCDGKNVYLTDEWDFVTDIDIMHTPVKKGALIYLSACETGKHIYAGGGHFQGLAQAFLKKGASNVVSSLIPLYDNPSRDFASSFYEALSSHKSVSTALQETRRKIKRKYDIPGYWLPYIHYGSP